MRREVEGEEEERRKGWDETEREKDVNIEEEMRRGRDEEVQREI
jgi:hypothetical protein